MDAAEFFQAAVAVVPLLLLILATEQKLNPLKPTAYERLDTPILLGGAILLASLIISALLSMGALIRGSDETWVKTFVVTSVAAGFAVVAWRLGWSIWHELPEDRRPADKSLGKRAFFVVGVLTVLASIGVALWALT